MAQPEMCLLALEERQRLCVLSGAPVDADVADPCGMTMCCLEFQSHKLTDSLSRQAAPTRLCRQSADRTLSVLYHR